ncbi:MULTISPECIES: hypothetical protein [Kitasatospora]|uniref:Uncharacterized protein n=1 Tax=Kitasatospora cathayae TaxID=3004092 RepID=A0ABY7QJ84_9ACTN|nr:hypothetical protein [Kitasatospora sp. HUAS 3-15]WBP91959.1 hypothetical protein O1G21_39910 [Kitasatospora sp. HUAS 3-15]
MSDSDGDLRARLAALEAEVDRLREESAATRTMAAMADRDSAEVRTSLRGHTQVLNAIREDQVAQRDALVAQGRTLERLAEAVGALAAGQAEQSRLLESHSRSLEEHGSALAAQATTLEAQGKALETLMKGQASILVELRRLNGQTD